MRNTSLLLLVAVILLSGCGESQQEPKQESTASPPAAEHHEINWHKGNVDDAFALAKAEGKPVFLYWGAIWCPPCQEIKNTVFKTNEFIALSELFVPVYLDGDTPQAQAQGERFGVQGYPTMIVFNTEGDEITRLPGGIDISRYNSILELSLNQMRPTSKLVELALNSTEALQPADYTQLAFYSWGQDFKALPEDAPKSLFKDLSDLAATVDAVASARLYMQYLVSEVQADGDTARIEGAVDRLREILANDELVIACWDSIAYWPETVKILKADDAQLDTLRTEWSARVFANRHSSTLTTAEQLAGWLPKLYYHFDGSETPLSKEETATLKQDLADADRSTTNAFARQSVINQMNYVYQQAKMFDDAKQLLLAELDRSAAPYYFMSSLGSIAEKQDNTEESVDWYRKAYEASQGEATRFQWGASYVRALIRMKPEDKELILATSEALFKELKDQEEVFTGRNFRILRSLNKQLAEWNPESTSPNPEGDQLNKRFVTHIESLCESQQAGSLERENCQSLVQQDAAT